MQFVACIGNRHGIIAFQHCGQMSSNASHLNNQLAHTITSCGSLPRTNQPCITVTTMTHTVHTQMAHASDASIPTPTGNTNQWVPTSHVYPPLSLNITWASYPLIWSSSHIPPSPPRPHWHPSQYLATQYHAKPPTPFATLPLPLLTWWLPPC